MTMNKHRMRCLMALWCLCVLIGGGCHIRDVGKTPTPTLDMHELMIDGSAFPTDWSVCVNPLPPPERAQGEHGEIESLQTQLCHEGTGCETFGAAQRLYRYRSEIEARRAFESDFSTSEFPYHKSVLIPWHVPEQWVYHSGVADLQRFACAQMDMGPVGPPEWRCTAAAQYGQYVSALDSNWSPECMTLDQLGRVLVGIDERMAFYLGMGTD
jgi:hypothetical protein